MVIAHNVRSAYNVGAIFRVADGMGADKVYLTGYTPFPCDREKLFQTQAQKMIIKTALGAEKNIQWDKIEDLGKLLNRLKLRKVKIVALEQNSKSVHYKKFKPCFPLALIVGNEPRGIDKRILNRCDQIIEIPMHGKKNSLNVAVALAIAGYEIRGKIKTKGAGN